MRYVPAAALALAALLVGCGADPAPPAAAPPVVTSSATPAPKAAKRQAVADPSRIQIPSIGVDSKLVELGLKENREMEVPPVPTKPGQIGNAGWYTEGPKPGEVGGALIAGHVDNRFGPDVFARLKELRKGAEIVVTDADGKTHAFVVERKTQTAKDKLDTAAIWGENRVPALRLITCGGSFDKASGHYTANVTIFANAA
ncbi:MAG: class F sortase [Gemmatimonadaceae bacterium]